MKTTKSFRFLSGSLVCAALISACDPETDVSSNERLTDEQSIAAWSHSHEDLVDWTASDDDYEVELNSLADTQRLSEYVLGTTIKKVEGSYGYDPDQQSVFGMRPPSLCDMARAASGVDARGFGFFYGASGSLGGLATSAEASVERVWDFKHVQVLDNLAVGISYTPQLAELGASAYGGFAFGIRNSIQEWQGDIASFEIAASSPRFLGWLGAEMSFFGPAPYMNSVFKNALLGLVNPTYAAISISIAQHPPQGIYGAAVGIEAGLGIEIPTIATIAYSPGSDDEVIEALAAITYDRLKAMTNDRDVYVRRVRVFQGQVVECLDISNAIGDPYDECFVEIENRCRTQRCRAQLMIEAFIRRDDGSITGNIAFAAMAMMHALWIDNQSEVKRLCNMR